tara:strand:+ start:563 stop:802 length:240 start_codon:yes stop_codon:yes gene_type:complete
MRPCNSKNKSFYHYFVQELNEEDNTLGEKTFYYTTKEITDKYNISRQTIYRILKNSSTSIKFKHYIEKSFVHHSILEHI